MTDLLKMGNRIRDQRESLGLTLKDVASSIGVASSTIMRYENGTIQKPKLPVIESIAHVLNVNPEWLCCKTNIKGSYSSPTVGSHTSFSISELEKKIIIEFRNADEITKAMVLRALSIDNSISSKRDSEKMA